MDHVTKMKRPDWSVYPACKQSLCFGKFFRKLHCLFLKSYFSTDLSFHPPSAIIVPEIEVKPEIEVTTVTTVTKIIDYD